MLYVGVSLCIGVHGDLHGCLVMCRGAWCYTWVHGCMIMLRGAWC